MRTKKEVQGYRGVVKDRMESDNHYTKYHTTWEEAHHAAERLAKRLGLYESQRWEIIVI